MCILIIFLLRIVVEILLSQSMSFVQKLGSSVLDLNLYVYLLVVSEMPDITIYPFLIVLFFSNYSFHGLCIHGF